MKSYLKTGLMTTIMAFSLSAPVFADHTPNHKECNCTKECQENCKKGNTKDCKCEYCDCKKSGDCGESCQKKKSL